ncbi:MAG TPA: hypothetical protein VHO24_04875 [Opitutaceae bacterium]|nr:hypothetical protein [Opitutaceae bacterium]
MILIRYLFWGWFFAAIATGHFLLLQRLPPPAIPVLIFIQVTVLLAAYFRVPAFHEWVERFSLRTLVLLHVTRFVGFYFLTLYARGQLPYAFAVPGGYGDIIVAALALLVALVPMSAALRERAFSIWNVVGLVDILLVVFTAARLGLADPMAMRALTYLPLSLLPTFLVPLIIATHVVIYLRLNRAKDPQAG